MLSDRDALLAAICASPEEDTPRLMFADWLDEHGEPERAEFIRLQCELARLADDGSDSQPVYEFLCDRDWVTRPSADWTKIDDGIHRRIALAMRAEDLARRHFEAWLPKLPKLPKKYKVAWPPLHRDAASAFRRGFAHRVTLGTLRSEKLTQLVPRLRAAVPGATLVAEELPGPAAAALVEAGLAPWLAGLDLFGECESALRELGHSPGAAAVRAVKVRGYNYQYGFASALADSPHWGGLRSLDLSQTVVEEAAAQALFGAPHLRSLKRLSLRGSGDWTAETLRALASGGFTELVSLRLPNCGLGDDAAELLANCPAFAKLRDLDLGHNNLTGRGVTALLTSPHLAGVSFLGLEQNPCNGLDAERLAGAKPGGLRMLHAHGCAFTTKDVRALARCPRLRALWYLDLDANNLTTAAVRELVRGFKDWCPPIVWLTYNRIDDRGAEVLAKWKAASRLRVLHLKHNPMGDAGARALLDSPRLADLDGLGLTGLSEETEARMKARFRHHDIDYG